MEPVNEAGRGYTEWARYALIRASAVPLTGGLLLVLLLHFSEPLGSYGPRTGALLALAALGFALLSIGVLRPNGTRSVASVYLVVFAAFHLGLAPLFVLGRPIPDFGSQFVNDWATRRPVGPAFVAIAVGLVALAMGVHAGGGIRGARSGNVVSTSKTDLRAARLALLTSFSGVVGWLVAVVRGGGIAALFSDYGNYLEVTRGAPLPIIYLLIGLGGALVAVAPHDRASHVAIGFLFCFAVVAFPLGLRGEVLFPCAGAIAVRCKVGGVKVGRWKILAILLAVLVAISVVRSSRVESGFSFDGLDLNPINGLAEMGYSLRPVAEVYEWQATGDEPLYGRTYSRPFERAASRVIPTMDRSPASEDPYIMNVVVAERVGPIGFSPVAEGVVNGGLVGVAGYMFVVGFLLGRLDRARSRASDLVLIAVLVVPLLIQTRNSFVSVPALWAVGVGMWAVAFGPVRLAARSRRISHAIMVET